MNEGKREIMNRILELSDTTLEGLEHIKQRTMEGYFEQTTELFTDVMSAFHQMETALEPLLDDLETGELKAKTEELVQAMRLLLAAYEGEKDVRPIEILQFSLLPRYRSWQEALRGAMGPYTAS